MKQITKYILNSRSWFYILVVSCTTILASCNSVNYDKESDVETGELQILGFAISSNVDVEQLSKAANSSRSNDNGASLTTKSSSGETTTTEMEHIFSVTITNLDTQEVELYYNNHTYIPTTIVLESGNYSIVAQTSDVNLQIPDNDEVGFSQPRYYDQQEVAITAGTIQSISMDCKQITAGVTVNYSDLFKALYPCLDDQEDYYTVISTNHESEITFLKDEVRTAHFTVHNDDMEFYYQIFVKQFNNSGELEERIGEKHLFPQDAMPVTSATNYSLTIMVDGQ